MRATSFPLPARLGLFAAVLSLACADLTAPASHSQAAAEPAAPAPTPTAAPAPTPVPAPTAAPVYRPSERITASHILVAYKGSTRAAPTITRDKPAAKKQAEALLARAKKGEDFAKLARESSDDPTAKQHGGSLGSFDRATMTPAFSNAAFALKPNQLSDVVETEFGFHVIKRTE